MALPIVPREVPCCSWTLTLPRWHFCFFSSKLSSLCSERPRMVTLLPRQLRLHPVSPAGLPPPPGSGGWAEPTHRHILAPLGAFPPNQYFREVPVESPSTAPRMLHPQSLSAAFSSLLTPPGLVALLPHIQELCPIPCKCARGEAAAVTPPTYPKTLLHAG